MPSSAARPAPVSAARAAGRRWRTYLSVVAVAAVVVAVLSAVPVVPWQQADAGAVLGALAVMIVLSMSGLPTPATHGRLSPQWQRGDDAEPALPASAWHDFRAGIADARTTGRRRS